MSAGKQYGRYVLEDRIAMGGMAEIFRAHTATAGFEKRVCIKRILPHFIHQDTVEGAEFITMFRDEARTAAKLQHANVVQVFDFGEQDGTLFLAMELIDGADLRRILEQAKKHKRPLLIGECVQIAIDVCRGLHHAHTLVENGKPLGVVHRDISPHNILVSRAGEVKVTDFGIARAAERATHTSTGIVKGKVAYMSPEQAQGLPFDHRLDQFALGVVLWEMLTSLRLFTGENDVQILKKVLNCEVPPPSSVRREVPPGLDEIVLRMVREDPAERYADMRQLELALSRFLYSGVIDPETADVRNVFARIMAEQPKLERKTQIASAAQLGGEVDLGPVASAPQQPKASSIEGLTAGQLTESSASSQDAPSTPAPATPSSADAAPTPKDVPMSEQTSSSGGVSLVFSSSEKNAPAPGGPPARATASRAVVKIGSVEADPNAITAHEPFPVDASPPPALTTTGLPTVEELELSNALPQPKSADSTPATRTNVPRGASGPAAPAAASLPERSSKKQPPAPPPDSSSGPAPEYPEGGPAALAPTPSLVVSSPSVRAGAASSSLPEPEPKKRGFKVPVFAATGAAGVLGLSLLAVNLLPDGARHDDAAAPPPPPVAAAVVDAGPAADAAAQADGEAEAKAAAAKAAEAKAAEAKAAEAKKAADAEAAAKADAEAKEAAHKAARARSAQASATAAAAKKRIRVLVKPATKKSGFVTLGGVRHEVIKEGTIFDDVPEGEQTAILEPYVGDKHSVSLRVVANKTLLVNFE